MPQLPRVSRRASVSLYHDIIFHNAQCRKYLMDETRKYDDAVKIIKTAILRSQYDIDDLRRLLDGDAKRGKP